MPANRTPSSVSAAASIHLEGWVGERRQLLCQHLLLALMIAVAFGEMTRLGIERYGRFRAGGFDLGINQQEVWLLSHGLRPFATIRGLHFLGDHFTPILYLLAPFAKVFTGPLYILYVQYGILCLSAWPIYRLTRRRTGSGWLGVLLSASYLCHPSLWGMGLFDFHPVCLAVLPLIAAVDALDSGCAPTFVVWCILALVCEERMAPSVFLLGLLAWHWKHWKIAWLVMAGSLGWLYSALKLMAAFSGSHSSSYWSLYGTTFAAMRQGPLAVLKVVGEHLGTMQTQRYLLLMLAPMAFTSLGGMDVLAVCLPVLLSNLLSDRRSTQIIGFQYDTVPLPMAYAAAAIGLRRIRDLAHYGAPDVGQVRTLLSAMVACGTLISLEVYAPHAISQSSANYMTKRIHRDRNVLLKQIPPDVSVSAMNDIVPHLAQRREVYMFPNPVVELCYGASPQALLQQQHRAFPVISTAEFHRRLTTCSVQYLVLDHFDRILFPHSFDHHTDYIKEILDALTCPAYGIVAKGGDLLLLKKGASYGSGLRLMGISNPEHQTDAQIREALLNNWRPTY